MQRSMSGCLRGSSSPGTPDLCCGYGFAPLFLPAAQCWELLCVEQGQPGQQRCWGWRVQTQLTKSNLHLKDEFISVTHQGYSLLKNHNQNSVEDT